MKLRRMQHYEQAAPVKTWASMTPEERKQAMDALKGGKQ